MLHYTHPQSSEGSHIQKYNKTKSKCKELGEKIKNKVNTHSFNTYIGNEKIKIKECYVMYRKDKNISFDDILKREI